MKNLHFGWRLIIELDLPVLIFRPMGDKENTLFCDRGDVDGEGEGVGEKGGEDRMKRELLMGDRWSVKKYLLSLFCMEYMQKFLDFVVENKPKLANRWFFFFFEFFFVTLILIIILLLIIIIIISG